MTVVLWLWHDQDSRNWSFITRIHQSWHWSLFLSFRWAPNFVPNSARWTTCSNRSVSGLGTVLDSKNSDALWNALASVWTRWVRIFSPHTKKVHKIPEFLALQFYDALFSMKNVIFHLHFFSIQYFSFSIIWETFASNIVSSSMKTEWPQFLFKDHVNFFVRLLA